MSTSTYDKVYRVTKGQKLQYIYDNLPNYEEQTLFTCLEKYGFNDEDNIYMLNPLEEDINAVFNEIKVKLQNGLDKETIEKYLIVVVFIGHGVAIDNK